MRKKWFIMALLILAVGLYAQWSSDPSVNNAICDLAGDQVIPKVVPGPTGDIYIAYFSQDAGNYDVRLQRMDSAGNELWDHNGILISNHTSMSWLTDWDMTVDQDNYSILTFQDIRNGNNEVYAYRISPDGAFMWGDDGIQLSSDDAMDVSPKVCVTSANYSVITWGASDGQTIIMQKIAPDGTLLWGASGITLSCSDRYTWPQPFAVENDQIMLKYFHDTGVAYAPTRHCYVQKYDADGNPVWTNPAIISEAGGISAWTQIFNIISDGNYGCIITWHDNRTGISYSYAQHVNSDGTLAYAANGVQLSSDANTQNFYPESMYNTTTSELITYWHQTDYNQNNYGLTGQKLDASGNLLWGTNGLNIIPISSNYVLLDAVRAADDDAILIYEESPNATDSYIKAMKLDSTGNYVWTGNTVTLCSVLSAKVHVEISQPNNNQIIVGWEDDRSGTSDIYAQNINFDGTIGPAASMGTVSGTVTLNGGSGNVEAVLITVGTDTANPDASGNYEMELTPGNYTLTAELDDYESYQTTIEITSGNVTTCDITLNYAFGILSGTVTLNGGSGDVEAVLITVGTVTTNPDASGNYEIELTPGNYTLTAELDDYEPFQTTVELTAANITVCDITLEPIVLDPPVNLAVVSNQGENFATFSWDAPAQVINWIDDMDSYTAGQYLALQSDDWTTWSNSPGGSDDGYVVDENSYSGANSVKIEGSSTDLVHEFGAFTSGVYDVSMMMYINSGYGAYYNLLHYFNGTSSEWGLEVYFGSAGTGSLCATEQDILTFTHPVGSWFEVLCNIDLDTDWAEYYVDGTYVYGWQWSIDTVGNQGSCEFGAIDIFASALTGDNPSFYCDDVTIEQVSDNRDLTGYNVYLNDVLQGNTTDTEWVFDDLENGTTYTAGVEAVYDEGTSARVSCPFVYNGLGNDYNIVPKSVLAANYPNPFNPTTTIDFSLKTAGHVSIEVYNIKGEKVKTLVDEVMMADDHSVIWNGDNENGKSVASGVYFYKMKADKFVQTRKMILMK